MKNKNFMKRFFALLLAFTLTAGFLAVIRPAAASVAGAAGEVNDGTVYDAEDNALYRYTQNNVVFNAKGEIVYDNTSTPLYYDPATKEFKNDKQNVLSLYERPSSRGGQYLQNGTYKVRSVAINDTFYELPRPNGGVLYASVLRVKDPKPWYEFVMQDRYHFEFYDLLGKRLSSNDVSFELAQYFEPIIRGWQALVGFISLTTKYPGSTLFSLLEKIELVNDGAVVSPPGTETPGYDPLYDGPIMDDRGKEINVVDGQLFDYFDYPVIGVDSKPLFYADGVYFGIDGRVLRIADGFLFDGDKKVHSVIGNLLNGELLYFVYMRDNVTICPLHGTPQLDSKGYATGKVSYMYLDGSPIKESDFVIPRVSIDDIYERYPETKPPVSEINNFFDSLFGGGSGCSDSGVGCGGIGFIEIVLIILGLIAVITVLKFIFGRR